MSQVVVFGPHRISIGREEPSLFGGRPKWAVRDVGHLARLYLSGEVEVGLTVPSRGGLHVDLLRLLDSDDVDLLDNDREASGPAKMVASLLQRDAIGTEESLPLSVGMPRLQDVASSVVAWLNATIAGQGNAAPGVLLRAASARERPLGQALFGALNQAGWREKNIEDVLGRLPAAQDGLLVVNAFEVRALVSGGLRILCGHGQAATLAAGLAPHIVRRMVALAGPEADVVWRQAYDPLCRAVALQQVERTLLSQLRKGGQVHLGGASCPIFPPLPESSLDDNPVLTKELAAYQRSGQQNERLDLLLNARAKKRQRLERQAALLFSLQVSARLPSLEDNASWFDKSQVGAYLAQGNAPIACLGASYQEPLGAWLAASGRGMAVLPVRWFRTSAAALPQAPSPHAPPADATPIVASATLPAPPAIDATPIVASKHPDSPRQTTPDVAQAAAPVAVANPTPAAVPAPVPIALPSVPTASTPAAVPAAAPAPVFGFHPSAAPAAAPAATPTAAAHTAAAHTAAAHTAAAHTAAAPTAAPTIAPAVEAEPPPAPPFTDPREVHVPLGVLLSSLRVTIDDKNAPLPSPIYAAQGGARLLESVPTHFRFEERSVSRGAIVVLEYDLAGNLAGDVTGDLAEEALS